MTFSVIIPAYNASRYITRCIESVKAQAFTDFECIIINDGSTDDTLALCQSLTAGDARFVMVDIPNGGVSNARNKGLERATGEYVLFLDADDWVEPTWLQELSQHCNGVDIVQFDFCEVAVETKREIHIDSDVNMIVQGEGAVVWKRAYRRELVADLRFDTTIKAGEDYLFSVQVFLRSHSYRHIDSCLYNYYVANEQSTMHMNFAGNFGYQLLVTSKVAWMSRPCKASRISCTRPGRLPPPGSKAVTPSFSMKSSFWARLSPGVRPSWKESRRGVDAFFSCVLQETRVPGATARAAAEANVVLRKVFLSIADAYLPVPGTGTVYLLMSMGPSSSFSGM